MLNNPGEKNTTYQPALTPGDIFIPYQPSFIFEFTDYAELRYRERVNMLLYQFKIDEDKDGATVTIVPDGSVDIMFCCDESETTATVCGSVMKGEQVTFKSGVKYFGVRILPGYCLEVLGSYVQPFVNKQIPLVDVMPAVRPMLDQVTPESDLNDIINIVKTMLYLNESNGKELPIFLKHVLRRVDELKGDIKLEKLAEEIGYAPRYFSKVFQDYIGINPKLYCRIIRFQKSLMHLFSGTYPRLADLVAELNYYDESHLLRDYHYFCQITPCRLIQKTIGNNKIQKIIGTNK